MSWFEREENQYEKLVSKMSSSCSVLQSFLSREFPSFVIIICNIVFSIVGALYFDWRTALSTMGLIPLILLSQVVQLRFMHGFS